MTINELIERLNGMKSVHGDMTIRVQASGGLGGYPAIHDVTLGFDWNHNSIVLIPKTPLTIDVKAMERAKAAKAKKGAKKP